MKHFSRHEKPEGKYDMISSRGADPSGVSGPTRSFHVRRSDGSRRACSGRHRVHGHSRPSKVNSSWACPGEPGVHNRAWLFRRHDLSFPEFNQLCRFGRWSAPWLSCNLSCAPSSPRPGLNARVWLGAPSWRGELGKEDQFLTHVKGVLRERILTGFMIRTISTGYPPTAVGG